MASSLCIILLASAAIVDAIPRNSLESSYAMDVFNRQDEALSMQVGQTCPIFGAHEDCQTAQIGLSGSFHLCPGDGDPCDRVKPCFYSRVCRCDPILLNSPLLKCNSTTTLRVEGTFVNVTHNILITPGTNVPDEACFTIDPDIESCDDSCNCITTDPVCINRTLTGDESSCTAEGCQCKRGFAPPDCCNCSRNFFGPNCENEVCDQLCGSRLADGSCLTCLTPLFTPPTCCNCTEGYTRFDFECKCTNGTNADGSCKPGFGGDDCCQCSPDYYKNPDGTCTPFCANNTVSGDASSCTASGCTCKPGYAQPDCCSCDSGYYKHPNGSCLPFCATNTVSGDSSSCTASGICDCKIGYAQPDCCNCNPDHYKHPNGSCLPFCATNTVSGDSSSCTATGICSCKTGYAQPDCCQCSPDHYKHPNGSCLPFCATNTISGDSSSCTVSGICTCKPGYARPDCCNCDPDYYKHPNGSCLPFCRGNTETGDSSSCSASGCKCAKGYAPPDCCKCPDGLTETPTGCEASCNINQNLFFLLDGSEGNTEFCTMAIVIHMLVAAFNPTSGTSGTKLSTVLFHKSNTPPSVVFGLEHSCSDIQGRFEKLQQDYQHCNLQFPGEAPYVNNYPSICGKFTRAVDGLETIRDLIPPNQPGRANALVIMTDGVIDDGDNERKAVLDQLKTKGVSSILVSAVSSSEAIPATEANLIKYTVSNSKNDVIIRDQVIDVGIDIVGRMEDTGVICKELAANITQALKDIQDQTGGFKISTFCQAQRVPPYPGFSYRVTKYPDCGGSLKLAYGRSKQQMESANLEEEILAAVESVLESYNKG